MNGRIAFLFISLSLVWGIFLVRGFVVQVFPHEKLDQIQKKQFETSIKIPPRRGAILGRKGEELAITVPSYSIFLDPKEIKSPKLVSKKLGKLLGLKRKQIRRRLKNKKKRFVWLKRDIPHEVFKKIQSLKLRGVGTLEEPKRVYPNGTLLSQTLGFVGSEGEGLEGLELAYNDILQGQKRRIHVPRDARGRPLLESGRFFLNSTDGADIRLTIDTSLQHRLEAELMRAIEEQEAKGALGIVMNPKTGAILAMASGPSFDSNRPREKPRVNWKNRVATDLFEPGSTLKTLVIAQALRKNLVKPSTRINCEGGRLKVGGRWIKEADKEHEFDHLSVSEILTHSSNIGMVKIGQKLGAQSLRQGLLDFGLGQTLGFELQGESRGILPKLPWRSHHAANISFGQGVAATALQIASAYVAIANGGELLRPYVVQSIQKLGAEPVQVGGKHQIRRVLTEEQARTLKHMLTGNTQNAGIPGYPVAGKTGTAQKVRTDGRGYVPGGYISSFAGFVPAHDPQFVIYIAVDEPQKEYYGNLVAAPIFSSLGQFALRNSGQSPILISNQNLFRSKSRVSEGQKKAFDQLRVETLRAKKEIPSLIGLSLREVLSISQATQIPISIRGQGRVTQTHPKPGESLRPGQKLKVLLQ